MTTLEVVRWSETMDLAAFRARLGGPALLLPSLGEAMTHAPGEEPSTAVPKTVLVDAMTEVSIDLDGYVMPIVRAASNPFSDKIAIGRTRNCDVRIDHPSISRLHALLQRASDGGWTLLDAGSSNGTRVNGEPVEKHRPVRLHFGDVVAFGSVPAQFVSSDSLYNALKRLKPLER